MSAARDAVSQLIEADLSAVRAAAAAVEEKYLDIAARLSKLEGLPARVTAPTSNGGSRFFARSTEGSLEPAAGGSGATARPASM